MNDLANLLGQLDPVNKKRRGTQFEHICKWFLENDPRFEHMTEVWLWDDWPGNWGYDAGIDLVAQDQDGHLWAIQAKAYSDKYWIKKKDVDTFLSEAGRPGFTYRLLIGTTNRIRRRSEQTLNEQAVPSVFFGLSELEAAQVNWPASISDLVAPPLPPKQPEGDWAYQGEAVNAVVDGFSRSDRGQMIMACGTGKTITSLFIKEKLAADRTLVLAPSLSLLSQTLTEWTANATTAFEYLPVCSDETVDANDSIVMSAHELGDVTTNPVEIADFLRGSGPRVVFSTYQSTPEITKAFELGGVAPFDLVVADEAHRTVGPTTSPFTTILDNAKIPAQRRLFMTATPRTFTGRVITKAAERDYEMASMDDEAKYGPVFHRLSFAEAIERGLLTDYQVAIIGVDEAECRELAEEASWVESDGIRKTDARTLAAQIGLAKAMKHYDLRRAISFHTRVESARWFSHTLPEVISWMPDDQRPTGGVWADYVKGEMTARKRRDRLRQLGNIDQDHRGLLSNARCLTEGVDVPTLDGVLFVDPKRSEVDIVQALGRAIRLAPDKTLGTIIIPVFISSGDDYEAILDDSTFDTVWRVIRALRMHDEELAERLDSIRLGMGRRLSGRPRDEKIQFIGLPTRIDAAVFTRAFDVRLISSVTAPWLETFGALQEYDKDNGTTIVPPGHKAPNGTRLDIWERAQRSLRRNDKLSAERIEMLDSLSDWSWEPFDEKFEKFIEELQKYFKDTGATSISQDYKTPDGYLLGARVGNYRAFYRNGKLSAERIKRLKKIDGWSWEPRDEKFEEFVKELQKHFDVHGTTGVSGRYKTPDGFPLGSRANTQRMAYKNGKLSDERIKRLKKIGDWSWSLRTDRWTERAGMVREYYMANGTTRMLDDYKTPDGFPLGAWATTQRINKRKGVRMSVERIAILDSIGDWSWELLDPWMEFFGQLQEHYKATGTTYVPDNCPLGAWSGAQRRLKRRGKLSDERIELLTHLGDWSWELRHEDKWTTMFGQLKEHYQTHGTTSGVPKGTPLANWMTNQISFRKAGKLSDERIAMLETLGDWSRGRHNAQWQKMFDCAEKYYQDNGTVYAPYATHKTLYVWIRKQLLQYSEGKLSAERIELLTNLGDWNWDK